MEIIFKTSDSNLLNEILNSPIIPALIAIVATALGFLIKDFLDNKKLKHKSRERILLDCIKLTELKLQIIIQKSISDLWFDFHQRMYDLTQNSDEKERALEHLEKSSNVSMNIFDINAELIKNKTEFQLNLKLNQDENNQLDSLIDIIINFTCKHSYDFPNKTQEQMLQFADVIPTDIKESIKKLRPKMIEARTNLLNFIKPKL